MSEEKHTDTEEWQIDSLEEEDDIIELTDEIAPPPPPKATRQDQLDEIVVDLDDTAVPDADEEIPELTEATADAVGLDDLAMVGESEADFIDLGEKPFPDTDEAINDLLDGTAEDVDTIEAVIDLDDEPFTAVADEATDEAAEVSLEGLLPEEDAEQFSIDDTETEVDIDEVADLEPIVPETIPEMEPLLENDGEMAVDEKLSAGLAEPVPAPDDDIIEISEFDQQYFDDAPPGGETGGMPSADDAEEDDFLELIDVDEAEEDSPDLDDEIVHFDRVAAEDEATELDGILSDPDHTEPELEPAVDPETAPIMDISSRLMSGGDEAPVSAAKIEGEARSDALPVFFESSPGEEADMRTEADGRSSAEDETDIGSGDIPAAVSAAQIEAAVANIIERDYAGQIENLVATAIEKVVRLEIERIKSRLFEDEQE